MRLFGNTDDTEKRTDDDTEDDDPQTTTGITYYPNSGAEAVASHQPEAEAQFGKQIPSCELPQLSLGGNPLRIEDVAQKLRPEMEEQLIAHSLDADFTVGVCFLGGTGYPLVGLADVEDAAPQSIELLIQSHRLQTAGFPPAKPTILSLLSYPLLDTGCVLIDHRDPDVGYGAVAPEVAQMLATLVHDDVTNRMHDYYTAFYRTIPVGGKNQAELSRTIQRRAREEDTWFTPEWWAPHLRPGATDGPAVDATAGDAAVEATDGGTQASPVVQEQELDIIGLVPRRFDRINGENMQIRPIPADVEHAHVLGLRPLDTHWVEERLKRRGLDWLQDQIETDGSRIATVWRSMCAEYGIDTPVQRFRAFREKHLDPQLH
ncbi:MAG: hypothetical protein ABEJ23_02025 [Haloarculaceae archaeon]